LKLARSINKPSLIILLPVIFPSPSNREKYVIAPSIEFKSSDTVIVIFINADFLLKSNSFLSVVTLIISGPVISELFIGAGLIAFGAA
jgi:hypothetical protein